MTRKRSVQQEKGIYNKKHINIRDGGKFHHQTSKYPPPPLINIYLKDRLKNGENINMYR